MNRLTILVLGSLAAGLVGGACGGVSGDSLFAGSGGGATFTTGSTSTVSSTTVSSSTSSTTTSSSTTSSTTSTTSSTSSTTSTSVSSSSGTPLLPVSCDDGTCNPGEICCFDPVSNNPPDHCGQAGQCGSNFVEISCSGPAACPGQVCCANVKIIGQPPQQQVQYTGISCAASCDGMDQFALCSQATPFVCGAGQQCVQSGQLGTGYFVCN